MSEIEIKVIELLQNIFKCEVDLNFKKDEFPAWDSLKHIEVLFLLEDEFDIKISEEEMSTLTDVTSIVRKINNAS